MKAKFVTENLNYLNDIKYFSILYHGTTLNRSIKIKRNGFSLKTQSEKSNYGSTLGISLTSDYNIAKEHAEWAVEKFKGEEFILEIFSSTLKILKGNIFAKLDNNYVQAFNLYEKGLIDGVELYDEQTGDNCEEFEVFIFNIDKLNTLVYQN